MDTRVVAKCPGCEREMTTAKVGDKRKCQHCGNVFSLFKNIVESVREREMRNKQEDNSSLSQFTED